MTGVQTCALPISFDWPLETAEEFDEYFDRFLVPGGVSLLLNGRPIRPREARHRIEAQLTTEIYNSESHSWQKPRRKTIVELVDASDGEEPFIYEMGIPVAAAEWTVPFHANILPARSDEPKSGRPCVRLRQADSYRLSADTAAGIGSE